MNKRQLLTLFALTTCLSANAQQTWSLQACIDTAFSKNISLNQQQLGSDINKINLSQSKSNQLPNLNLSDAHNLNYGSSLITSNNQYVNQNSSINNLSLYSSVTLFNGFQLLNTVKQNKLIYDASALDVEKTKNDIMLNVLAGYMQVLMDYEAINVTLEQVKSDSIIVNQTKKFVEFGKVAELNLLQTQSQLASDNLAKVNAENQLQLDKITLLQLMDTPATNDFDVERQELKDLFPEIPMATADIEKISESFLPEIKSASLKTNAALFNLKIAESSGVPKLMIGGGLKTGYSNLNNDAFSNQFQNNFSQTIGLTLAVPIFNNFLTKNNVAIAKINVMDAKLNEQQTKNDVRKSIETVYTNQVSAGKKLVATEDQMKLEQETYNQMGIKYNAGALDATTYLIEENNYNKVSMNLIQAKYDYVLKSKMVDFYTDKPLTFK